MANGVKHLLEFGPYRADPERRLLLRGQNPVALSPKAFDLLLVLLERSGEVVSKDDLMKLLWPDTFVEESNLGQHVFQLRKALGDRPQDHTYIVTVPGRGYRFAEQVRPVAPEIANIAQDHKREEQGEEGEEREIVVASRSLQKVRIEGDNTVNSSLTLASQRQRRISVVLVAITAGVIVASYLAWRRDQSTHAANPRDRAYLGDGIQT
jgi:DNA-binding winged helix-turn-helix (wHTH) protein